MEAERVIQLLRIIRHDFSNHLQVIAGYAELRMYERLKDYIGIMVEEMVKERELFDSTSAEVALYFFEQMQKIKELDVILQCKDLEVRTVDILEKRNEPYASIAVWSQTITRGEIPPVVHLSLYEDSNGIDMIFTDDPLQPGPKSSRLNRE